MSEVRRTIERLLEERESIANRDVVAALGGDYTRQAVNYHLRRLVEEGRGVPVGRGRARRYRRSGGGFRTYPTEGLAEHEVWRTIREEDLPAELPESAESILRYAFTEMLNNAIDHSESERVHVRIWDDASRLGMMVVDEGVGVFQNVASLLGLTDLREAVAELSKGKLTTLPERHSGEGIFFTSKAVDLFVLESDSLRWTVDNERGDQALGQVSERRGTLARAEIDRETERTLTEVFAAHTGEDLRFSESRVTVRLFDELGPRFVSRSEARGLARRLEQFDRVVLDFAGVLEVGQAFVDELFRVWQSDHPGTVLEPINMVPAVEFMVRRGFRAD